MIYVLPNEPYEATFEAGVAGLVGTIHHKLIDPTDGTIVQARVNTGVVESAPGIYTTTRIAPADAGLYLIVWDMGDPNVADQIGTEQVNVGEIDPNLPAINTVRPEVLEVADHVMSRLKAPGGQYQSTFNSLTMPKVSQIERLITKAQSEVTARVGPEAGLTDPQRRRVRSLIALYAAMLVELNFFPEQIETNRSPYNQLRDLYDSGLNGLTEAIASGGEVVTGEGDGRTNPGMAYWYFDPPMQPVYGRHA